MYINCAFECGCTAYFGPVTDVLCCGVANAEGMRCSARCSGAVDPRRSCSSASMLADDEISRRLGNTGGCTKCSEGQIASMGDPLPAIASTRASTIPVSDYPFGAAEPNCVLRPGSSLVQRVGFASPSTDGPTQPLLRIEREIGKRLAAADNVTYPVRPKKRIPSRIVRNGGGSK